MGWIWASNSPSAASAPAEPSKPVPPPQSTPAPASTPPRQLSRDELAEQELNAILQEFHTDTAPRKPKYSRSPVNTNNTSTNASSSETEEPLGSQLLPTTMSCRVAFDEAFYCNSFGGRFNDLYRYGNLRSCSEHWNNFWFCMKTRSYSGPSKEAAVKEHYRRRESAKYSKDSGKESSENVWKSRERRLDWDEAFSQPFPKFDGTDEDFRKLDAEYRKKTREEQGTMG